MLKYFVPNAQFLDVFTIGSVWAIMKDLANHKAWDIYRLKSKFLKWVANHLCELIT